LALSQIREGVVFHRAGGVLFLLLKKKRRLAHEGERWKRKSLETQKERDRSQLLIPSQVAQLRTIVWSSGKGKTRENEGQVEKRGSRSVFLPILPIAAQLASID